MPIPLFEESVSRGGKHKDMKVDCQAVSRMAKWMKLTKLCFGRREVSPCLVPLTDRKRKVSLPMKGLEEQYLTCRPGESFHAFSRPSSGWRQVQQ